MDAHQERLNFQMTRISEVNQHLNALMETSEKVNFVNYIVLFALH